MLGQLDHNEEVIAKFYDDVVGLVRHCDLLPLLEEVARALVNKGFALGQLDHNEEEIAFYDDVVGRFGMRTELPLRDELPRRSSRVGAGRTRPPRGGDRGLR